MLKDWYVKLHTGSGPTELSGQLTYALSPVSYRSDSTKACRMLLCYSNPACDMSIGYDFDDPNSVQRIDYEVEINPANLDFTSGFTFADQIEDVVVKAEDLIKQKQHGGNLGFLVPNTGFGIQDCDPKDDSFTLESAGMGNIKNAPSYVKYESVLDVDLAKLQDDVHTYLDYYTNLNKQQNKAVNKRSTQSATLIDKLENLTPDEMVTEVNNWIKRKKISLSRLLEILIQDANTVNATNVATTFYDLINKDSWLTKDGSPAYEALDVAFQKATYDNGKPLTGYNDPKDPKEWHDYFEHYDRDQDYDSIFDDERVTRISYVIGSKTDLALFFDFTSDQLIAWVDREYSGAEYAHDFK